MYTIFTLLTAVSIIRRDDELSSCGPIIFVTNCQPSSITNTMFSNLVTAKCIFQLQHLGLLAGNVSLNPGPFGSNDIIKWQQLMQDPSNRKQSPSSKNLDIVAVTETGLKHDKTQSSIADISPPGCSLFHEPRADQRTGGGVGILVSDQLTVIKN